MRHSRMYVIAASYVAVACTAVRTDTPTAVPDADFTIPVRGSVRIEETPLTIRFDSVTEDSRCPTDVQCVWAGNATVRLTVLSSGHAQVIDLKTSANTPATLSGNSIELRGLLPARRTDPAPSYREYVATLRVTK
jgi:hypothetical protein